MDIRMLLSRVKFLNYLKVFIMLLIAMGIVLIIDWNNKAALALFIYLLSIFISYIKTIGFYVLYIDRRYKENYYLFLDNIGTFIIVVLFGYKFISLFNLFLFPALVYLALWLSYLWWKKVTFTQIDNAILHGNKGRKYL